MKKSMLRFLMVILALMIALGCLVSCDEAAVPTGGDVETEIPVESLVLSNTELSVNVGNASAVSCTVLPEDASDKVVKWSCSNNAVATINDVGVITAIGAGTAIISASCGNVTETLVLTVKKPIDQIVLNKLEISIKEEESFSLVPTIVPNDASEKTVTWTSSDNSIATVDANGTVTGVKAGSCTITASADGKSAVANVTVKEKGPDFKALYEALSDKYGWTLGADHSYLTADTNVYDLDDYSNSSILYEIKDMNKTMGLPDSLYNDMLQTTWSMGKQQETFEEVGVKVTWTYHPDKGLEVTYKLINH